MADQPLHILFISSWFPTRMHPFRGDFVERHAWAIAKQHRVSVLHVEQLEGDSNFPILDRFEEKGVQYFIYYQRRSVFPVIGWAIDYVKKWRLYQKGFSLINQKECAIDLIHANITYPGGYIAYKLSRKFKTTYIITEHHTLYNKRHPDHSKAFSDNRTKLALKHAGGITSVSHDLLDTVMQHFPNEHTAVIPNVIYNVEPPTEKENYFIHVSSLDNYHKNVSGILTAFNFFRKQHEEIDLLIVGGKTELLIKDLQRYAGEGVTFLGNQSHTKTLELIGKSQGLIQFSRYETFSIVVAEAISLGIPVITTACGGPEEYLTQEMGIITPPEDIEILAKNMERLLTFDTRESLQNRNKILGLFGEQVVARQFDQFYKTVLKLSLK